MPSELSAADRDNLIRDYATGTLSVQQLARKHGITTKRLTHVLDAAGVIYKRAMPLRTEIDTAAVIEQYQAGASLKSLAASFGVSRDLIQKRLLRAGVRLRSSREQQRIVAQTRTPERRREIAQAANAAARGRKARPREGIQRALTNQGKGWESGHVGQNEIDLAALLAVRGHATTPQVACGPYNIDLTLSDTIAVEVHGGGWHAVNSRADRERRRLEHLLDAGWNVCIVTAHTNWPISGFTADHVIAFAQQARTNPPGRGQYRMIRSDGKLLA